MKREKSYKKDLVQYRLDLAQEVLQDARLLKENGGSPVSIVYRAYSSVFYSARLFRKEMSRIIHHAFDMCQAGDYQKSKVISEEQAVDVLTSAEVFVRTIREKLL